MPTRSDHCLADPVEPDELEALIADRSAGRAADLILKQFVLSRRAAPVSSTDFRTWKRFK